MKEKVKKILDEKRVDLFIGYRLVMGHPLPWIFDRNDIELLDELVDGPARYPLEKMALKIARQRPEARIGLLARDCSRRALEVLFTANQLDPELIVTVGLNCCPSPLKENPDCSRLKTDGSGKTTKPRGLEADMSLEDLENLPPEERFSRWAYEFSKCIKCYGCRDVCPVCFCEECSLEHPDLVRPGRLPVEIPVFHLTRAVHMAGRCIDCGLCEEACPFDIPLRLLYSKVSEIMDRVFKFRAGAERKASPLGVIDEAPIEETPIRGAA